MKFSYTIVNKEGKKLTGTIDGENENIARDELNKLGFPVLDMVVINAETAEEMLGKTKKFEFEAIDKSGRKIIGNIAGENRFEAFKRLVREYHFTVEKIWEASAGLDIQEEQKNLGVVDLYTEIKKESSAEKPDENILAMQKEQEEKEKYVQKHIGELIEKATIFMQKEGEKMNPEEKKEIQGKIDRLIRLKASSNIEYIRHLGEELLIRIESKAGEEKTKLEFKKLMTDLREEKIQTSWRQQILQAIKEWKEKNEIAEKGATGSGRIIWPVLSFIEDALTEPPEISGRKEKISLLSREIFSYYKLLITEKSPELRDEIKESIKQLGGEKEALKNELDDIKRKYSEEEELKEEKSLWERTKEELLQLLGWVL
ncbi:MAG: hypothetical protein AAB551_03690, partial [Patescibacteria group bacterium]